MKKFLSLGFLSLFLLSASLVSADTFVNYPATFVLKVGEKVTVTNYQNMQIELVGRGMSAISQSYPSQPRYVVEVKVTTPGGCGLGADPRCIGAPAFVSTFTISEGGIVDALALRIKASNVQSDGVTFSIFIRDGAVVTNDNDTVSTGSGGGVTASPPIIKYNDGTPGVVDGSGPGGGEPGVVDGSGPIIVCPMGATGEDCSICVGGECKPSQPPVSTNPDMTPPLPILNLGSGESFVSMQEVESDDDSSTDNVYEIRTVKKSRLFSIFPVSINITYSVNAETGEGQEVSRPWWSFFAW